MKTVYKSIDFIQLILLVEIFVYTFLIETLLYFQVDTFTSVYKKLTGRDVTFEFPDNYLNM